MAHAGKEFRFREVGFFRDELGALQLNFSDFDLFGQFLCFDGR